MTFMLKCELNHTADYAVNPGLMTSKTPVNNGCFNIVAYTEPQQTIGPVANGCRQFRLHGEWERS